MGPSEQPRNLHASVPGRKGHLAFRILLWPLPGSVPKERRGPWAQERRTNENRMKAFNPKGPVFRIYMEFCFLQVQP